MGSVKRGKTPGAPKPFIVKIQRPLAGRNDFLLYSEDRHVMLTIPADSPTGQDIQTYFRPEQDEDVPPMKVYVQAIIGLDSRLKLQFPVGEQPW